MTCSPDIADIIDLTANLTELETASSIPIISSANKRNRRESKVEHQQLPQADKPTKRPRPLATPGPRLMGAPVKTKSGLIRSYEKEKQGTKQSQRETGEEKIYKGVQYGEMIVEVDMMISSEAEEGHRRRGLVRRIVERRFDRSATEISCHVHWMGPSNCGQANEVFLKHRSCSDIALKDIRKVDTIEVGVQKGRGDGNFLQHVYDHSYETWRDPILVDQAGLPVCDSCISRRKATKAAPERIAVGWKIDSVEYHRHDFGLLDNNAADNTDSLVWRIGHIIEVRSAGFIVQLFERYSDWAKSHPSQAGYVSEKRLILTSREVKVSPSQVLYKVHLSIDDRTTIGPSERSFFCHDRLVNTQLIPLSKPIRICSGCVNKAKANEDLYQRFKQDVSLPAIDYYSGGGGGMIGGREFFHHAHAVDMEDYACMTLNTNFPGTKVHHSLVSDASDAARRGQQDPTNRHNGNKDMRHNRKRLRMLPEPGSMVLASAGPPCQGHSGANHQNQVADERNNELLVVIDEVDRLRPDVFILENVPGMKRDRGADDPFEIGNFAVQGIRQLRHIGYQVRLIQLNSRSFGSPQSRNRLFIICARQGVPLPSIPEPTHANPDIKRNIFLSGGAVTDRPFYVGSKGSPGSGPLPAVTVKDAISDLPPFEYVYSGSRNGRRIPTFAANPGEGGPRRVGFLVPVPYALPPSNDYQRDQRQGASLISNHYTPKRTKRLLDLILAAHTVAATDGSARKADPNGAANTLLTESAPGGKYTAPIHYDQLRTFTVAERKRFQGVPDDYVLCGGVVEKDRQVGNMINIHLSRALHGHIHRQVFFAKWLRMGQPSDFLKRWREAHPI